MDNLEKKKSKKKVFYFFNLDVYLYIVVYVAPSGSDFASETTIKENIYAILLNYKLYVLDKLHHNDSITIRYVQ